ncbi:MAG: hypothetical protein RR904_05525, partial [Bacilli bacterium]
KNGTSGDFINVQIEQGTSATNYEPYQEKKTTIVLNEPLRKVGDVADYIDYENNHVVRNFRKISFNGINEENLGYIQTYSSDTMKCFKYNLTKPYVIDNGNINAITNNFSYVKDVWSKNQVGFQVQSVKSNGQINFWFKLPKSIASDLLGAKIYLAQKPITLIYQLETPIYEEIKLPAVSTLKGITNIEVTDGTMNASNIEVVK